MYIYAVDEDSLMQYTTVVRELDRELDCVDCGYLAMIGDLQK